MSALALVIILICILAVQGFVAYYQVDRAQIALAKKRIRSKQNPK